MRAVKFFPHDMVIANPDSWWTKAHSITKRVRTPEKDPNAIKTGRARKIKRNSKKTSELDEEDQYAAEADNEDIYDDSDGEYQKYDLDEPAFIDDESNEPEMIYNDDDEDEE